MHTVENGKIRVTVTPEIWARYAKDAEAVASFSGQDPQKVLRGLILSEAMRRLQAAARGPEPTATDELLEAGVPLYVLVYGETLRQLKERWLCENAPEVWRLSPRDRVPYSDALRTAEQHADDVVMAGGIKHGDRLRRYVGGERAALSRSGANPVPADLMLAIDAAVEAVQAGRQAAAADLARKSLDGWKIEKLAPLHFDVPQKQKTTWVRASQREGMKLVPWVVKTLDAAANAEDNAND